MFKTSDNTDKLDAAIAKAQAKIQPAVKDKTNPAFRSKYADLAGVWDACRAALTENGVCVTQWPIHSDDSRLHLITRLACAGQWMMAEISIPTDKQSAHGYGSAITYAKRFGLAAAVGVVADEDDDGNAASASTPANNGHRTAAPKAPEDPAVVKSREDFSRIMEALNLAKLPADIDKIITAQGKTLAEIKAVSQTGYEKLMAHAEDRKANMLQQAA